MKKTNGVLFLLIIGAVLFQFHTASAARAANTQGASAIQIQRVLENQARILAALAEIKEELNIVKIRASLR